MHYRREIDGLRAVALIPVLLFHASVPFFGGGFIGVDVFFVISGYLITSIILTEHAAGSFSLSRFYERRARRILPALFATIAFTIPAAWWLMLPSQFHEFATSVTAASLSAANVFFFLHSGYFDLSSELRPLLHIWSLAVEEQFYFIFPLLLMAVPLRGKQLTPLFLCLAGGSFLMAVWGNQRFPEATFFLPHSRAWELLAGSLCASYLTGWPPSTAFPHLREISGIAGLGMILAAATWLSADMAYPGAYTLLPVMGTVLIIISAGADTFTGRILSSRPIVGIGLISYSVYLIHQPVFALARLAQTTAPGPTQMIALILVSIGTGALMWRYVERPFRRRDAFTRQQIFKCAAFGIALFSAMGIGLNALKLARPLPPNIAWESLGVKQHAAGDFCVRKKISGYPGLSGCLFGAKNAGQIFAFYGDSHLEAMLPELDRQFIQAGWRGIWLDAKPCGAVPGNYAAGASEKTVARCEASMLSLQRYIRNIDGLVLAARWTFKLYPVPGMIDELVFDNGEGGREVETPRTTMARDQNGRWSNTAAAKRAAVTGFVDRLTATGKTVVLVYPVPETGWDIAKVNALHYRREGTPLKDITTSYDRYKQRNRFVIQTFDALDDRPNLRRVRPDEIFCNRFVQGRCVAQLNTRPFYYDDDHLSDEGAGLVVEKIIDKIKNP